MLERVLVCLLAQGHLLIEGGPGSREDPDHQDDGRRPGWIVRSRPVHARPRSVRPRRDADLPPAGGHLRHGARPRVLQLPPRGRDQPCAGEGAVGAPRGHAGAAGDDRPRDASGAVAVPGHGDAEPDRVRGDVSAARGADRPLPAEGAHRLSAARRGAHGRPAPARRPSGAPAGAVSRGSRRPPAGRLRHLRRPVARELRRGHRDGDARAGGTRRSPTSRSTSRTARARAGRSASSRAHERSR